MDATTTDTTATAEPAKREKAVINTVKMLNGEVVDFVGNRKMNKEIVPTPGSDIPSIKMQWANGETRTFPLPQALLMKLAEHGALQKFGDECAGVKDLDDQIAAVEELAERLARGEWAVKRAASEIAGTSVLMQALMELKGLPKEKVKEFLAKKTQAEKIALRNNPAVKPLVDKIEAAKAAKDSKVNSDALLADL